MRENAKNQEAINQTFWRACEAYRGKCQPEIYKDWIFNLLFLKYISDVYKIQHNLLYEKYGAQKDIMVMQIENMRFSLPKETDFYFLYESRFQAGNGERIDRALRIVEVANVDKLHSMFQDVSFNQYQFDDEKEKNDILRHVLELIAEVKFEKDEQEHTPLIMGRICEYLLEQFSVYYRHATRELYTPAQVSDLLIDLMQPQEGDDICDPVCGSGTLLLKCGDYIKHHFNGSKRYALYGQEVESVTWSLAKMNLFMHHEDNHRIERGDTLRNPKLQDDQGQLIAFDLILGHPPFSQSQWGYEQLQNDRFNRFDRGLPPKTKGDYAFILHMLKTLKPDSGRMGVVMPRGVLFRGAYEAQIRQKLVEENLLDAVIGLPEKILYGTQIAPVILVFKIKKQDSTVLFVDASQDFISGKVQNTLDVRHIEKIVQAYHAREHKPQYAEVVTAQTIANHDFNLNLSLYVDRYQQEETLELEVILQQRQALQKQLDRIDQDITSHLQALGYVQGS
tara:strand:+ start:4112 stop:5632 length:1521 start_codon:yes stop_codon:yes gene_type:complete